MTRTDLINWIIRSRQYNTYLEIGVGSGRENFDCVQCERKLGVDPASGVPSVLHFASDVFFEVIKNEFDLIFIDGLHEAFQVDRDIAHSLRRLTQGGVVVLHDCLPPDEWHQRPSADCRPDENWNGTVWKSALRFFAKSQWCCFVVDCDWGCGVIDTAFKNPRALVNLPPDLSYQRDFSLLRQYVVSEDYFVTHFDNLSSDRTRRLTAR